jgi:hypothetical protein
MDLSGYLMLCAALMSLWISSSSISEPVIQVLETVPAAGGLSGFVVPVYLFMLLGGVGLVTCCPHALETNFQY